MTSRTLWDPQQDAHPEPGDLWLTRRDPEQGGDATAVTQGLLVLMCGARTEAGTEWFEAVPAAVDLDDAREYEFRLLHHETTLDAPLRIDVQQHLFLARSRLDGRVGALASSAIADQIGQALAIDAVPLDRRGRAPKGEADPRADRPFELSNATVLALTEHRLRATEGEEALTSESKLTGSAPWLEHLRENLAILGGEFGLLTPVGAFRADLPAGTKSAAKDNRILLRGTLSSEKSVTGDLALDNDRLILSVWGVPADLEGQRIRVLLNPDLARAQDWPDPDAPGLLEAVVRSRRAVFEGPAWHQPLEALDVSFKEARLYRNDG